MAAGPTEEQRVLHGLARYLAAQPAHLSSSSAAVIHLRAKVAPGFQYSGGALRALVAARPDVFGIQHEGDTHYRLRLGEAAAAPPAAQPPPPAATSTPQLQTSADPPFFAAVAASLGGAPAALTRAHQEQLAAAAAAHWAQLPHGANYLRAAAVMMDASVNKIPPLALASSGELVFACNGGNLGALLQRLLPPAPPFFYLKRHRKRDAMLT
jgi:hypothetical protein